MAPSLLSIPPELRNRIYHFVFAGTEREIGDGQHPLMRTGRQVRNESLVLSYALPAAFGITIDQGEIDDSIAIWLKAQPTKFLSHIQAIKIHTVVQYDGGRHFFGWENVADELLEAGFAGRVGFCVDSVDIPPMQQLGPAPASAVAVELGASFEGETLAYLLLYLALAERLRERME